MNKLIKSYWENGYILVKNFIPKKYCSELRIYLNKKQSKIKIPFSNEPWGYGNLLNDKKFEKIINNDFINNFATSIFKNGCNFNHLTVNNKAPWIGPDVELHQEVYNMKTYAPGCNPKRDWKKFFQIFISIDNQTKSNGALKIIPKSHKLGPLKYVDIIGANLGHKRRVAIKDLEKAYKKYGLKEILLNEGDALFFNHLLIHGSPTNISPKARKAIVLQARDANIKKI